MPSYFTLEIALNDRLDRLLAAHFPDISRRRFRELIQQGSVYADNRRIRRQGWLPKGSPLVKLAFYLYDGSAIEHLARQVNWPATILHRHRDFLAVNKPPGIPTAPTRRSAIHNLYACLQREGLLSEKHFPGNRLDQPTSGVIIIPLTQRFAAGFNRELAAHSSERCYIAIAEGIAPEKNWRVEGYLSPGSNGKSRLHSESEAAGRFSLSRFETLETDRDKGLSLLAAWPHTGRTHQIRVHLQASGLPVLGDTLYGARLPSERLMLHCHTMRLMPPLFKEPQAFHAPLPEIFRSGNSFSLKSLEETNLMP